MPDTRFTLRATDGRQITGCVQGAGGVVRRIDRIERAIRQANRGRDTGIYEPSPGHCLVFTEYGPGGNGPGTQFPLIGSVVAAVLS